MLQVKIFSKADAGFKAYGNVQDRANKWLAEHPEVCYIDSHTNMHADETATEFALTLIVELPDVAPPTQDSSQTQSLDDLQLDRMGDDSLAWQEIRATVRACPQIHLQDRRAFGSTGWNILVPGVFGETAHSPEELLDIAKGLQKRL